MLDGILNVLADIRDEVARVAKASKNVIVKPELAFNLPWSLLTLPFTTGFNQKILFERAATLGNVHVAQTLLDLGFNINTPLNACGDTALHLAARSDNATFIQYLISQKADVNAKNWRGECPVHLAVEGDFQSSLSALLGSHKIQLEIGAYYTGTPLEIAAEKDFKTTYDMLIAAGAKRTVERQPYFSEQVAECLRPGIETAQAGWGMAQNVGTNILKLSGSLRHKQQPASKTEHTEVKKSSRSTKKKPHKKRRHRKH